MSAQLTGLGEQRHICQKKIKKKKKNKQRLGLADLLGQHVRINCKMFSKVYFGQSLHGEEKCPWLSELGT